jgi:hypothetical protein
MAAVQPEPWLWALITTTTTTNNNMVSEELIWLSGVYLLGSEQEPVRWSL